MNYVDSFKIFGQDITQIPCMILNNAPTENTFGVVGMLAIDSNSDKKDLYKCIEVSNDKYVWNQVGSSSTEVVTEVPEANAADPDVDYIVNKNGVCLYYKLIDGEMKLIAGSVAEVVDTIDGLIGNTYTDYYVPNKDGEEIKSYFHYRWDDNQNEFVMIGTDTYSKDEIDTLLADITQRINNLPETYSKTETNNLINQAKNEVAESYNQADEAIRESIRQINENLSTIDRSTRYTYDATYGEVGENVFALYQIEKEGEEGEVKTTKAQFVITGGAGGTGGNKLSISYVEDYKSPLAFTTNEEPIIYYNFSGKDPEGDDIASATATWYMKREGVVGVNPIKIGEESIQPGENLSFTIPYQDSQYGIDVGTWIVTLTVEDNAFGRASKDWKVTWVELQLDLNFDDTVPYPVTQSPIIRYTPKGAAKKYIHFLLDGEEIHVEEKESYDNDDDTYTVPRNNVTHGSHLLEVYMDATVNKKLVSTDSIFRDILWYEQDNTTPIIGTRYHEFSVKQQETFKIDFSVYDPTTISPEVIIYVDGEEKSKQTVIAGVGDYNFSSNVLGNHTIEIKCTNKNGEEIVKTITATVEALGVPVKPVTDGLAFDFNPVGKSNKNEEDKNWTYTNEDDEVISMSVSDNFDWNNGGYKYDKNGDQYFCIKAGTFATIDYKMFDENTLTKQNGKEFKLIFKTVNVSNPKAKFLECIDKSTAVKNALKGYYFDGQFYSKANEHTEDNKIGPVVNQRYYDYYSERYYTYLRIENEGHVTEGYFEDTTGIIGIEMKTHEAYIYANENKYLHLPYSEEDVIEFEFNINESNNKVPMIMGYEDGVATTPLVYGSGSSFSQNNSQNITLGSPDCDLWIYRFKVYKTALSDKNILNNFIADARTPQEIISRYERNQIYDKNTGKLTPESVANACPWLRVIKIDTPIFTNDKNDRRFTTSIEQIYRQSDSIYDNWIAYDCVHSGQGTSSNKYGAAGRNLDLMLKRTKYKDSDVVINPDFKGITLKDGTLSSKVPLTDKSVPVNYFNVKVNIASSENANNALLQQRYNQYNPYDRSFVREEGYDTSTIKDTMEFHNCVIFIRENDTVQDDNGNYTNHREFNDLDWHFYAIGNIGDSKKTDDTRLTDPDDDYECICEIMDVDVPLASFPVDTMINAMGYTVDEKTGEKIYTWAKQENLDILYELIDGEYIKTQDTEIDLTKTYYVDILIHDDFSEDYSYGWRYISDDEDPEILNYCKQKWIDFYRFITTSSDEDFKAHLGDYFVLKSAFYYYLFTTRYTMVDNRAKNTFWHYGKTGEIDGEGNPIRKWDLAFDYDNDTSLGIDNDGDMVYRYGFEDIDKDENGTEVFRVSNSTFFTRLRDNFSEELGNLYRELATAGAWSANDLITTFDKWQNQFPEELWRVDIERKYIRTYTSSFINGDAFPDALTGMAHGRKKYQRREFERNQEKYMASKYLASPVIGDMLNIRCKDVRGTGLPPADYTLNITPYAHMYIQAQFGEGNYISPRRLEPGKTYSISSGVTKDFIDIIDIYNASAIQSIGDISLFYPKRVIATSAYKLNELLLGTKNMPGYVNTGFEQLSVGTSINDERESLIERLNIENVQGLSELQLQNLRKLKELKASNSGVGSVTFAKQGAIETVELPAIQSIFMSNLMKLTKFDIDNNDYSRLEGLFVENSHIDINKDNIDDLIDILGKATNLNRVRITGIDWTLYGTSLLNTLLSKKGYDENKNELPQSVLAGKVRITGPIRQSEIDNYKKTWKDLVVEYDKDDIVQQFNVTYVNYDGKILHETKVDIRSSTPDPYKEGWIVMPTRPETAQYKYQFGSYEDGRYIEHSGWTYIAEVVEDVTVTAVYTEILQKYPVYWYNGDGSVIITKTVEYDTEAVYDSEIIPTKTDLEALGTYRLFNGWNQCTSRVRGPMHVHPKWLEGTVPVLNDGDKINTEGLNAAQIYGITKRDEIDKFFEDKDAINITIGHDFDFENVKSKVLIEEETFFDPEEPNIITPLLNDNPIKLFEEDASSFTLAVDYEFTYADKNSVLFSCTDGKAGFSFYLNNDATPKPTIKWGDVIYSWSATPYQRNIIVIRYKANEKLLHIYSSATEDNLGLNTENGPYSLTLETDLTELYHSNPLIFGKSNIDTQQENLGHGLIHWSKIWQDDIGHTNAEQAAKWPRETLRMEYYGQEKYNIIKDGIEIQEKTKASFICSHLLYQKVLPLFSNQYVSGWGESESSVGQNQTLRTFLKKKFFFAFPKYWQILIKTVALPYLTIENTLGSSSDSGGDTIYVPSMGEMTVFKSIEGDGEQISWFGTVNKKARFRKYPNLITDDADFSKKIFRMYTDPISNGIEVPEGAIWEKTASATSNAVGSVWRWVSPVEMKRYNLKRFATGSTNDTVVDKEENGGWRKSEYYWSRSARIPDNPSLTNNAWAMGPAGNDYATYGTGQRDICPCFSI